MTQKPISRGENAGKLLEESEIRYQHLLKTTLDGILVVKGDTGELMDVNPALVKMLGFPREELQGNKFWEIGLFNSSKASQSIFQDLLRKETIRYSDISLRTKDGRLIHAELICTVYRVGRRKTIQCVLRDITEQRQALTLQDAIYRIAVAAETTKSLNDLFPEIHEIILSVMPAENFYITLYDEKQNLLRFPYFKDALDEPYIDEIEPGKGLTAYVLKTGKSLLCTQAVHDDLERQGKVVLLGVPSAIWLGVPLIIEEKTIGAMVVQHYTDPQAYGEREQHMLEFVSSQVALAISRKQVEDKLRHMSTHDMLTGLFNRTFCDEEIARLQRGRQFPVSIVIADVDDLKKTNDLRGHAAGDDLLISVAKVLTTAFRREDMVARIGGDEFIVLMPKTAAAVADEALRRVRGLLVLYNAAHVETPLHLSLGVSTAQKGTPLAEVLKEADRSMYAEKQKHMLTPNQQPG